MKPLNERFHIDNDQLIKTSNGQPIPPDEPVFILRGRDELAIGTLRDFRMRVELTEYSDPLAKQELLKDLDHQIGKFRQFAIQNYNKMKLPNITRGK